MRKIILTACGLALSLGYASALTIDLTPGGMSQEYVTIENTLESSLVLKGSADVRDLAYLKNMSGAIRNVDMSALEIKAYTYPEGHNYMGRTSFAAGELPHYALIGSNITSIILPADLKKIGDSAFVGSQLESIVFPDSEIEIGNYAFANVDRLQTVTFNNKVTLGVGVFKDCDSLTEVNFKYITEIPASLFDGCFSFTDQIPEEVVKIGDFAYRGTAIESLDLSNVKTVGDYAFAEMKNLREILVRIDNEMNVGRGAFFHDDGLDALPALNSDMSSAIFAHSKGVYKEHYINSEKIEAGAFANNSSLDTIFLGENVKHIGAHAFRNLTSLSLVDVQSLDSNVIQDVDTDAFSGLENADGNYDIQLNVADGTNEQWAAHDVWKRFIIGNFDVGVDDVVSDAGVDVKIRKVDNSVNIMANYDIDYVGIFSLNGMTLHESKPASTEFSVSDLGTNDIVVVKVICRGIQKIVKLK